jgi:signal transduction histidine kinase
MDVSDLRDIFIFDGVSDDQLQRLIDVSEDVRTAPGDTVFVEGEPADCWWVLVDGQIELIRHSGGEDTVVGGFDVPGRWSGGFRAWDEEGVYLATGRATTPGRMLRVPSESLRELVGEFPLASHLIDGLFHTARNIEAIARQRESLVALGRLSAGLAHELNNPAAATTRAVDALEDTCNRLLDSLGALARADLTAEQFTALDELRRGIAPPPPVTDALALSRAEDTLTDWLEDHDVDESWVIAPALAAAGVDVGWCDRLASTIPPKVLGPAVSWVASTLSATSLLSEIKESTSRVSGLVGAVKSYSQMDRASLQRVDLTEGLESTLVMLGHRLRDGVTVVRDYAPDVPPVEVYAGALNQVWTNLIDNAVDAMSGHGTLQVSTRVEDHGVVVEITDDGPGMDPEVAQRAFEPFFTTKEVGKGTGLGLDIARRIVVERHRGTITVASRPGATTFRITLPTSLSPGSDSPASTPAN